MQKRPPSPQKTCDRFSSNHISQGGKTVINNILNGVKRKRTIKTLHSYLQKEEVAS